MKKIRPQRRRPIPATGIVVTRGKIGIHDCIISTPLRNASSMDVLWKPGRPPNSNFLPEFESKFEHLKEKHMQKLADITQQTISAREV